MLLRRKVDALYGGCTIPSGTTWWAFSLELILLEIRSPQEMINYETEK